MLVQCKLGCKYKTSTNAVLDVETNEAICEHCNEVLDHISSYGKAALKSTGHILKKKKGKSFSFKCTSCKEETRVCEYKNNIVGKDCATLEKCKFNISDYMKRTVSIMSNEDSDENDGNL